MVAAAGGGGCGVLWWVGRLRFPGSGGDWRIGVGGIGAVMFGG